MVASEWKKQNPWASREKLPRVSPGHVLLTSLICFLCAISIPFCTNPMVALLTLAVLFAYVAGVGRRPLTVAMVLVTTLLFTVLGSVAGIGFTVGAVLLSLVVGCATVAFLMSTLRHALVGALIPIAAVGVAFAVTRNLPIALSALAFLPGGALLAFATLRAKGRTTAICFAQCGLMLSVLAGLAVLVWRIYGSVGPAAIRAAIDAAKESLVRAFEAFRDYNIATLESVTVGEQSQELIDRVNLLYNREMALQIFSIFPAVIAVLCGIVAYEAQSFLNASYKTVGLGEVLTANACFFSMSTTSAILFVVSFILSMLVSASTVPGAVMQNLSLLLMPGLAVIGLQSIVASVRHAKGSNRIFLLLLLAFFVCCTGGVFYMLAFWGSYGIVMLALQKKMVEKIIQGGRGGDSSNDSDHEDP